MLTTEFIFAPMPQFIIIVLTPQFIVVYCKIKTKHPTLVG